jgi:hypothetical protein
LARAIDRQGGAKPYALDFKKAALRPDPAMRRKAPKPSIRGEHAMAGYEDRIGIACERLSHGPRGTVRTDDSRQGTIGEYVSRLDTAGGFMDAAMEGRHAIRVERNAGKISRRPPQQSNNARARKGNVYRRLGFASLGKSRQHTPARPCLIGLRELNSDNSPRTPHNGTGTDHCFEQSKTKRRHGCSPGILQDVFRSPRPEFQACGMISYLDTPAGKLRRSQP